jgi:hypothetical protein
LSGADGFGRDEFSDSVIDFALGQLTGRERAAMLAHLEGCMRCRLEVQDLNGVVDELLLLAPAVNPPAGFEDRLSHRLSMRHARQRRFRLLLVGVALIAVAAIGFGAWSATAPGGSSHSVAGSFPTVSGDGVARTGTLLVNGVERGVVVITFGQPDWMVISVRGTGWTRVVTCRIALTGGRSITAGSFVVSAGDGSWGTALSVPIEQLRGVILADAHDSVLGQATFAG